MPPNHISVPPFFWPHSDESEKVISEIWDELVDLLKKQNIGNMHGANSAFVNNMRKGQNPRVIASACKI